MQVNFNNVKRFIFCVLWALMPLAAVSLCAQTVVTWDGEGGDGKWTTATNWSTNALPSSLDTLAFGTATSDQSISLRANRSAVSVQFTGNKNYSFSGYTLALSGSGANFSQQGSGLITFKSNLSFTAGLQISGTGSGIVSLEGDLTGTGGFTKSNTGTVVLSGTNTYSGPTSLNSGILELGSANALGTNSDLYVASGAVLDSKGKAVTIGALSGSGELKVKSLTINSSSDSTFSGTITDVWYGSMLKKGTGTLTLTGSSTLAGITTIEQGALLVRSNDALGASTYGNLVKDGASLLLGGGVTLNEQSFSIQGSGLNGLGALRGIDGNNSFAGTLLLAGSATIGADAGASLSLGGDINLSQQLTVQGAGSVSFGGQIYGSSGIIKTGTGTLTFSGASANSNSGTLAIQQGTVVFAKNPGLIATQGALLIGDGVGAAGSAILRTDALGQIFAGSSVTVNSDGLLNLNGNSHTLGSLAGSGEIALGGATLSLEQWSGSSSFSGRITGNGSLEKTGGSTLLLSGQSSYTGETYINGILGLGVDNALPTGTRLTLEANAQLQLNGYDLQIGSIEGGAAYSGKVLLGGGTLTAGANNLSTTLGSDIQGSGGLVKQGSGTLTLDGSNSFSGTLQIEQGALALNRNLSVNSSVAVSVASGASFDLKSNSVQTGSLAGAGTVLLGSGTLTTGLNNSSTVFSGTLLGSGGISKAGSGILTLTGDNQHTGPTQVLAGTLRIEETQNLGASGTAGLVVESGAVLEKIGSGSLVFGTSMNLDGELRLSGGSLVIDGGFLDVGILHITGDSIIDFGSSAGVLSANQLIVDSGVTVTIINWLQASDFFFAQSWLGAQIGIQGSAPMNQIIFDGRTGDSTAWLPYGDKNQIIPVPEVPLTGLLLVSGSLLLALRFRKRTRQS